jgi:hypothetical protein
MQDGREVGGRPRGKVGEPLKKKRAAGGCRRGGGSSSTVHGVHWRCGRRRPELLASKKVLTAS